MNLPPPPECLSDRSKDIWVRVVRRRFSDGRLILLEQALLALDRAEEAREAVNHDGLLSVTRRSGVTHINPAARIERENRQLFARIWKSIGLGWNSAIDGR